MKQRTWWTLGAGLIAVLELTFSIGLWVERLTEDRTRELGSGVTVTVPSEFGPVWGDILLTSTVALAAVAIATGLYLQRNQPVRARGFLVAGLVPAALAGVVFFWFPPFWGVSILAIALIARVALDDAGRPVRV